MKRSSILALGAALPMLAAAPAAALAAKVSVRVEGLNRTLLPATTVQTRAGSITKGGTPAKACSSMTAAGALDLATQHRWNGAYGQYGLSVTSILGETHALTSKDYWSIWVDNRYATAGICGLKLHQGEQLLFAAVPGKGTEYPIALSAPSHARAGKAFTVNAFYFKGSVRTPLSGVKLSSGAVTNRQGRTSVTLSVAAGHGRATVKLVGTHKGYIRSAATNVTVTK